MEKSKPRYGYVEPCIEIVKIHENDLIQTSSVPEGPGWGDNVLDDGWT